LLVLSLLVPKPATNRASDRRDKTQFAVLRIASGANNAMQFAAPMRRTRRGENP
jgi:hypothetical protein